VVREQKRRRLIANLIFQKRQSRRDYYTKKDGFISIFKGEIEEILPGRSFVQINKQTNKQTNKPTKKKQSKTQVSVVPRR
jgi:hypothetical protein